VQTGVPIAGQADILQISVTDDLIKAVSGQLTLVSGTQLTAASRKPGCRRAPFASREKSRIRPSGRTEEGKSCIPTLNQTFVDSRIQKISLF
jgi:hypothetical protein